MRAAVLHATNDLRIEDRPVPECGPDDVLIEVKYNGLCGTDAAEFGRGQLMVPLQQEHAGSGHRGPTILGHEFIGTVVDAGTQAKERIGERVACGAGVSCGTCPWCQAGRTNLCAGYYTLGLSTHGGLAQYVAAPSSICVSIPEECDDLDAAMAQPLAVGIHALRRAIVQPGDTVALLGVGAIGSFILAALKGHQGEVIAFDIDEERLRTAQALGATRTHLLSTERDEDLRDVLPNGAASVFETSGVEGAAQRSLNLASRGGNVTLVGLTKTPQALALADIVLREVSVQTTVAHVCGPDMPEALDILTRDKLSRHLLHGVVPLEDMVSAALQPLVAGEVRGKVLVAPHG